MTVKAHSYPQYPDINVHPVKPSTSYFPNSTDASKNTKEEGAPLPRNKPMEETV